MDENLVELESFKISAQALQSIARLATEEVEGVELAKGFIGTISGRLGISAAERSIKVEVKNGGAEIRLALRVDYGVSIPEVVQQVQFKVKGAMESMTGLKVKGVNVSVESINLSPGRE